MRKFALLLILPCLIVADTQCDGGELSCPEDKTCCTVDGKASCCDAQGQLPQRPSLMSDSTNHTIQQGICFNCQGGTCCNGDYNTYCCPESMFITCCQNGCCPRKAGRCCGSWCCKISQRCGMSYLSCYGAAAGLHPTTLVTLIAVWFAAYVVTKL